MNEKLTLLPVGLNLFDGGDGNAGGPAAGSGPAAAVPAAGNAPAGGAAGIGPATGRGPTTAGAPLSAPPRPGMFPPPPPGAQQGVQNGAAPGTLPGPAPFPGPPAPPAPGAIMAQRQLRSWDAQAREVQAIYPGFDLGREAQDRTFRSLLRSGVPVRQAFEVLHMDQLRSAAERAVTANIKAKGARPQENGAGASSGFTVKDDVAHLTARDRAELAKRAARGEVITF